MNSIREPEQITPVRGEVDVVVAGAGPALALVSERWLAGADFNGHGVMGKSRGLNAPGVGVA